MAYRAGLLGYRYNASAREVAENRRHRSFREWGALLSGVGTVREEN